jgi:hypothetical protein
LPAGEFVGFAVQQLFQAQDGGRFVDPLKDFRLGGFAQFQPEAHVAENVHVGVEGIVLEHHGHVPVLGGDVVDDAVSDADRARCDFLQPGHHAQNGGFAAAGGAHQNHEFLVCDVQADAVDHFRFAEFLTISLIMTCAMDCLS